MRQRRAVIRQPRVVPPPGLTRQETLADIWDQPTPFGLVDIVKSFAAGVRGAGRAVSGDYAVQSETPGQWSEADEFRAQHARQQMRSDASALAGAIMLGSVPRVLARRTIDPDALGAGVPPRRPRLPMDAESVAARADAMGFRRDMPVEFGRAPIGEKIAAAAIDVNGRIIRGSNHGEAISNAERELGVPFEQMTLGPISEGFVTNSGRYVSRWEAAEIANRTAQGQVRPDLFGEKFGLASEDTRMSSLSPSRRGQTAATAPGLPGGEGIWGRVLPESAHTGRASPSGPPRPPFSDAHNVGPGIEATTGAAARTAPTRFRAERPEPINVRGLSDYEIQASLRNAWDRGFDAVLMKNYTTPAGKVEDVLVVRDLAQLRDPKARFDPAKINSRNVLATGAGLGLFAPLAFPLARKEQQSEQPTQ